MKILYIYNEESQNERDTLTRLTNEVSEINGIEFESVHFMDILDKYTITQTPTVIVSFDNIASDNLLVEDIQTGKLELSTILQNMTSAEFYTKYYNGNAIQLRNEEIERGVIAQLEEIFSSIDNLNAYPVYKAAFDQLVEAQVMQKIAESGDVNVLLTQKIEELNKQNSELRAELVQTNTDLQSFMDYILGNE